MSFLNRRNYQKFSSIIFSQTKKKILKNFTSLILSQMKKNPLNSTKLSLSKMEKCFKKQSSNRFSSHNINEWKTSLKIKLNFFSSEK